MLDCELVDQFLEDASEESTEQGSSHIDRSVVHLGLFRLGVGEIVGHLLEYGLDKSNGWVDATSGNAASFANTAVQSKTDGHGVDWHVLRARTVVLHDHEDEGHEQEGADRLNGEDSQHVVTLIVAAVDWAELSDPVVVTSDWDFFEILLLECEGHNADGASNNGSDSLEEDDEEGEAEVLAEVGTALLPEHADCDCRVEVPATYRPEYLSHDHDSEANSLRNGIRGAGPVDCDQQEHGSQQFREENEELVACATRDFHLFLLIFINYAKKSIRLNIESEFCLNNSKN